MQHSKGFALVSLLSTLLAGLAMLAAPQAAHAGPPKVTICHKPPGNPANAHTISVNIHAWPAHKAHGDSLGECAPAPDPDGDNDGGGGIADGPGDDIETPGAGNPGGGNPEDGGGGGIGAGAGGAAAFTVVLCDGRKGEQGRRVDVAGTGRVRVEPADCN